MIRGRVLLNRLTVVAMLLAQFALAHGIAPDYVDNVVRAADIPAEPEHIYTIGLNPRGFDSAALHGPTRTLYVLSRYSNAVYRVDTTIDEVVGLPILLGSAKDTDGHGTIATNVAAGKIYVGTEYGLSIIDVSTNRVTKQFALGQILGRIAVNVTTNTVYAASGTKLYQVEGTTDALSVFDLGQYSAQDIAVNTATNRLYLLGRTGFYCCSYDVLAFDPVTGEIAAVMPFRGGGSPASIGVDSMLNRIYANSAGGPLEIFDGSDNSVVKVDYGEPSGGGTIVVDESRHHIHVGSVLIDGFTNTVIGSAMGNPDAAYDFVRNRAYIPWWTSVNQQVSVYEISTTTLISSITFGGNSTLPLIDTEMNVMYIANWGSASLSGIWVLDRFTYVIVAFIQVSGVVTITLDSSAHRLYIIQDGLEGQRFIAVDTSTRTMLLDVPLPRTLDSTPLYWRGILANTAAGKAYIHTDPMYYAGQTSTLAVTYDAQSGNVSTVGILPWLQRAGDYSVVDSARNRIYVCDEDSLQVVNGLTEQIVATISGVAACRMPVLDSSTGRVFVQIPGENHTAVVDGPNATILSLHAYPSMVVAVNPGAGHLYSEYGEVFNLADLTYSGYALPSIASHYSSLLSVDEPLGRVYGMYRSLGTIGVVQDPAQDSALITRLGPEATLAGGHSFPLIITGTNFNSGAAVRWNGTTKPTTFVSSTQLTAQIAAADIAQAGTAIVTVVNAGAAAPSNALTFTITGGASPWTVTSVTVEHQRYPDGAWIAVPPAGTTDGNKVRITARIQNGSSTPRSANIQFMDDASGQALPGTPISSPTSFPASQSTQAVFEWDTSGFAWGSDGGARSGRRIKVAVTENSATIASQLVNTAVNPKPVILVHGWRGSVDSWKAYFGDSGRPGFLQLAHPNWKGSAVGLNMGDSLHPTAPTNSLDQNAQILRNHINGVRTDTNAWHVDVVAHSMGGLVSRLYIQDYMPDSPDGRPVVTHLIMLGTPNRGSICAYFVPPGWFNPSTLELTPTYVVNSFNIRVTNQRGVLFSILAGNSLPQTCSVAQQGDLVVPVNSALGDGAITADSQFTSSRHPGMTSSIGDFLDFVKPHLAVGPAAQMTTTARYSHINTANPGIAAAPDLSLQLVLAQQVQVPAGGSIDLAIPIPAASATGVVLLAPETISSSLYDPAGNLVDTVAAGSPLAADTFRSFRVQDPAIGTWRLHLENQVTVATTVPVSVLIEGSPLVLTLSAGQPSADGRVPLNVTITNNGVAVPGATVTATLTGTNGARISLALPDGGGGSYAATVGPLAPAVYAISVSADIAGTTRQTLDVVEISTAATTANLVLSAIPGGHVSVSNPGPYALGSQVALTATPDPGYSFTGWTVNGVFQGWAVPLTVTVSADQAIHATFATRPNFPDVTPQTTGAYEAIGQLAARGIIKGYADGSFGPTDQTLRAQMAALIVRAIGWSGQSAANPFADRNDVDDELWQAVAILAQHGVARGYGDGTYGTLNPVLNAQVVSFITRAMVAKGYWQFQPDDGTIYPNVGIDSGHRQDLVTYVHYAGLVRGTSSSTGNFDGWDQPSSRAWFAFVLWQALDSYFGVDRVP